MRPLAGACAVAVLGAAQISLSSSVAAVVGKYLDGAFPVDATHLSTCALSMKSDSICNAAYVSTAASILLSLVLISMQCATAEGRAGLGFCGPIISAVGFFWWGAFAAAATSAANGAEHWDSDMSSQRTAVVAISWTTMALFLISFFVSAAAASAAAARARAGAPDGRGYSVSSALGRALGACGGGSKRFNQPPMSPPSSPAKSPKNLRYERFDSGNSSTSPKKWAQPQNNSRINMVVTTDGLHTMLVVEGEPVPLSPNQSPLARSPMHRNTLVGSGGSGSSVGVAGTFTNVVASRAQA